MVSGDVIVTAVAVSMLGEMVWTRRMAAKYHDTAKEKNLRIVHCCGFDSIPSDLGTLLVVDQLNKLGKYAIPSTTVTITSASSSLPSWLCQ